MRLIHLKEENSIIDNKEGLGNVPNNMNIDYLGLRVKMSPSVFLKLAAPLEIPVSVEYIESHLENGGKIGAPFLSIKFPAEWEDNDFSELAKIVGHEGRNRMIAVRNVYGNNPIETHLLFSHGVRNRHLTPNIISHLNKKLISETGDILTGPFFTL